METIVTLTPAIFGEQIVQIIETHRTSYNGSLEVYLRSLLSLVIDNENNSPTHHLLAQLIDQAFTVPPLEFDISWLRNENPPEYEFAEHPFANNRERFDYGTTENNKDTRKYNTLINTIKFQIADLHRMSDRELQDSYRHLGITSPTNNSWYNFNVFDYFECAISGFLSHIEPYTTTNYTYCDWLELVNILELGRLYE